MNELELELFEGISVDTLTNKTTSKSVYLKSGMRSIFIGINTLVRINDFLRSKGVKVSTND